MSMEFHKGDRVHRVGNISKRGTVKGKAEILAGYVYHDIMWDDNHQELVNCHDLRREVIAHTAWDLLRADAPRDYREIGLASTLYKLRNSNSNTISTLKAARTKFMPYQYKPLLKFLNSQDRRLLVADEVGLGKTIEAGYIMLELAARKSLKSVLIVCTKSLKVKWIEELKSKFNFRFESYNRKELVKALQEHVDDPGKPVFAVVSYESLRLRGEEENVENDIYSIIEQNDYSFDFIVCDEAHKLRNENTQANHGLRRIIPKAGGVMFLTATPVMTQLSNLYSLIKLLDPDNFQNQYVFQNAVHFNKPFVKALRHINAGTTFLDILKELDSSVLKQEFVADGEVYDFREITVGQYYLNDPLYQLLSNKLTQWDFTYESRVSIQRDLLDFGALNYLYSRTRRVDVAIDFERPIRNAVTIRYRLSEIEQNIYDDLIFRMEENIGSVNRERMLASSLFAYLQRESGNDIVRDLSKLEIDTKFKFLIDEVIGKYVKNQKKKIVIFSTFIATIDYIGSKLASAGFDVAVIHGRIRDRDQVIEQFRNSSTINILISSEVGSEGLDFQFCDIIVNYDLPWNPMVIEQRIGRIDRIGQQSKTIKVINFVMEGSIEARIHDRLWARIRLFEQTIGDLEDILGENEELGQMLNNGMIKFLNRSLTEEQYNQQIDNIYFAIESEKRNLKAINIDLEATFSNDMHFQQEIERMVSNRKYISSSDLEVLLSTFLRIRFPNILMVQIELESNIYLLKVPGSSCESLRDFIKSNLDSRHDNPEMYQLANQFLVKIQGKDDSVVRFTFDQEIAFNDKRLELFGSYHPLINAIANRFITDGMERNQFFKMKLDSSFLDVLNVQPGFYFHALYNIRLERQDEHKHLSVINHLCSSCFNVGEEDPYELDSNISDSILSAAIENPRMIDFPLNIDQGTSQRLQSLINRAIIESQDKLLSDELVRFRSSIDRRLRQEIDFMESRNLRLLNQMESDVNIQIMNKTKYYDVQQKIKLFQDRMGKADVYASNNLVSITLIYLL